MNSKLVQVQRRIKELDALAAEIAALVVHASRTTAADDQLAVTGQAWYRGARELLAQQSSSGLHEFEGIYCADLETGLDAILSGTAALDLRKTWIPDFERRFRKARALVLALEQELLSREVPVTTQLSYAVAADEFDRAAALLAESNGVEAIWRAGGVVASVAIERHLFTVAEARNLAIVPNPPSKKKAGVEDVLNALVKASVITAVQRSHVDSLLSIADNCAHPWEPVQVSEVERLIREARSTCALIL